MTTTRTSYFILLNGTYYNGGSPSSAKAAQSEIFGPSKGTNRVKRIQLGNLATPSTLIACATEVPWYKKFLYTKCQLQIGGKLTILWLNTRSLKKRLSNSSEQIEILGKLLPKIAKETKKKYLIQTIRKHASLEDNQIADILKYAEEHRTEETTVQRKEWSGLARTLLLGPKRSYLLLTRSRISKDKIIGKGSFKTAKYAIDLTTGKRYVVAITKNHEELSVLKREIFNHEALKDCSRIVKLHASYLDESGKQISTVLRGYLVLDDCDHGDLFDYLRKGSEFKESDALEIAKDSAEGLKEMHNCRFLHRDLKEENIFLYKDQEKLQAKIGDLGLSCAHSDTEKRLEWAGTKRCYSPEKAAALLTRKYLPKKVIEATTYADDVWAFGLILFRLFSTNHTPLPSISSHDNLEVIANLSSENINHDIDTQIRNPQIQDLLKRMLSTEPMKRPSMNEVSAILNRISPPSTP